MISVNQRSQHLIEDLIDKSDYYRVGIKKGYKNCTIIDAG